MQRRQRADCYENITKGIWFRLEEFKNHEASEILTLLKKASLSKCSGYCQKTWDSWVRAELYYSQHSKLREYGHICMLVPRASRPPGETQFGPMWMVRMLWVCVTGENFKLGECTAFAVSSKQACSLCAGQSYLMFQGCLLQMQTW